MKGFQVYSAISSIRNGSLISGALESFLEKEIPIVYYFFVIFKRVYNSGQGSIFHRHFTNILTVFT